MASDTEKSQVQQGNSTEKDETKTDENEEEQMNNEESNKELGPQPKEKRASIFKSRQWKKWHNQWKNQPTN